MEHTSFFRRFPASTDRLLLALATIAGAASSPADGDVFSNFEPPTYASNTVVDGVDGWTGGGNGVVTPYAFGEAYGSAVLDGTQSLWMLIDNEKRSWSNSPVARLINTNDTYISWLFDRPKGFGQSMLYLSDNFGSGSTPAGLGTAENGDFQVFAPDGSDTGVSYQTNKVYQLGMLFDFTNNTFTAYEKDMTDGGLRVNLGTYHTYHVGSWDLTALRATGGLWLFDYRPVSAPFTASVWDNIEVIPEPGVTVFLAVAALFLRRR